MYTRDPYDPYRSLKDSLPTGDRVNGWVLRGARRQITRLLRGQRVLEVCCGTGSLAILLAQAGCAVVGVDRSATMLAWARQKRTGVDFRQMDAAQMPFQREFDAAVISLALHEMPPPVREQVWESLGRAIRPGGRLLALDFAVPRGNSLLARLTGGLIERDERGFASIDPAHYENYCEFMRAGGLTAWVGQRGQPIEAEYRFWAGTLALVVVRPPGE